ncbi:hypothetical protein C900_05356 [Fulvivirga imtechensis AK7]|uniref:Uncharacterized protein n=2 Tax=Fulvivirga TaxID=396811 RepID=L8JK21_9BACT|nr:hypothetical protein C900_05356 [Fulvivirga imtechensis AK7]
MYNYYLYHKDLKTKVRIEDPVGWDGLGKSIKRDKKLHGVFFEYTPKLQFIKKGKAIIHYFYEKYGIETELILIVKVLDSTTKKFSEDYRGRLNLTTLEISKLYATCNVENTGFLQKFKNRMDVKVDLQSKKTQGGKTITPFNSEVQTIQMHSKTIRMKARFGFVDDGNDENVHVPDNEFDVEHTPPFKEKMNFLTGAQEPFTTDRFTPILSTEGEEFPIGITSRTIRVTGSVTVSTSIPAEGVYIRLLHGPVGGSWQTEQLLQANGQSTYTVDFDETIVIEAEEEIIFIVGPDPDSGNPPGLPTFTYHTDSILEMSEDTTYPATDCPVMLLHEIWARVCHSITDQEDSFKSSYFGRTDSEPRSYFADGAGSLRGQTDGKLLRGFPFSDNPMHASFKDMFETYNAVDGIGVGIEKEDTREIIVVEQVSNFYVNEKSITLNYVNDIKKEVDATLYWNEILAGYKRWANEEQNNLDEFNSRKELTLPITQIKNRLSLESPYIASGYTLEFTRREQYEEGDAKDNINDNENFIIQLRRSGGGFVTDKDEDFAVLNGVLDPGSVYNAKLSIARNIIRNGPVIAGSLYKTEDGIKINFGEGNTDMVSRLNSETEEVSEGGVITKAQLGKQIWIPERYIFRHKLTIEDWRTLNMYPTRYVEFSATNKNHKKGYLMEAVPDQKTREVSFQLLRANL